LNAHFQNRGAGELPKSTAYNVLKFMMELNWVILQDTATIMLVKHPESRVCNPLF
jgi:hypothetical protein